MQTHTFSTGGIEITPANRLLLEAEISTNIGTIHSIDYTDPITIVIVEGLDMTQQIALYNIVTSYLIYRSPAEIKAQMCQTIESLTLTELQILENVSDAIYNRDPVISLRRKLCKMYQGASDDEILMYDAEFTNRNFY